MAENAQAIVELALELWNTGKPEVARKLYSEEAERHDPSQAKPARGVQQIAEYVAAVHAGFPDFKLEVDEMIAEGDRVVTRWTCTGTHDGTFQGISRTRRPVTITGMTLQRIKDGKIIEERVYFDQLAMLQQLGVAPAASQSDAAAAGRI